LANERRAVLPGEATEGEPNHKLSEKKPDPTKLRIVVGPPGVHRGTGGGAGTAVAS